MHGKQNRKLVYVFIRLTDTNVCHLFFQDYVGCNVMFCEE